MTKSGAADLDARGTMRDLRPEPGPVATIAHPVPLARPDDLLSHPRRGGAGLAAAHPPLLTPSRPGHPGRDHRSHRRAPVTRGGRDEGLTRSDRGAVVWDDGFG